jgi:hypothetical protein
LVLVAPPAHAAKGGKPNLVPIDADQGGQADALRGENRAGKVKFTVKNAGKKRSRHADVEVFYKGGGGSVDGELELVGRLAPGATEHGTVRLDELNDDLPAGAYKLEICVDALEHVPESNERDNCAKVKGSRYYSTYRDWKGSMGSIGPAVGLNVSPGLTETARSSDAELAFAEYLGGGGFAWNIVGGSAAFTLAGTDGYGCAWSGTSTFVLEKKRALEVNYDSSSYRIFAQVPDGSTYPTSGACNFGGFPFTVTGGGPFSVLVSDATNPSPLSFGATKIASAGTNGLQNFTWDLTGQPPG